MTVFDVLASLWRTAVPVIVGCVGAILAHVYIDIDQQALAQWLVAVFAIVYHGLFRLLESKVSPSFGWFLGLARPPVYPNTHDPVVQRYPKPPTT